MICTKVKLILILLFTTGIIELQAQTMYIKEKSGELTAYIITDVKNITFSSGEIAVNKTDESSDILQLKDLRYLSFKDLETNTEMIKKPNINSSLFYPNPVNNVLNIKLDNFTEQRGIMEILTLDGKVIFKQILTDMSVIQHIDVSSLQRGMYIGKISTGKNTQTIKILKN